MAEWLKCWNYFKRNNVILKFIVKMKKILNYDNTLMLGLRGKGSKMGRQGEVVYNWIFLRNCSGYAAPPWSNLECSLKSGDLSLLPPPIKSTGHSLSTWRASCSNPCPHFLKFMQNEVTTELRSPSSSAKNPIVYYWGFQRLLTSIRNSKCRIVIKVLSTSSLTIPPFQGENVWRNIPL